MRGIRSELPADTLAAALAPIAEMCEQLAWAVCLQSGPLQYPYWDEDDPTNSDVLSYLDDAYSEERKTPIFRRGFLPRYAECLVMDEWSYYLGFDADKHLPAELDRQMGINGLCPRRKLFEIVEEYNALYIVRVDIGWWEGYHSDQNLLEQLRRGWDGIWIDSDKWKAP
ncbi:MAG: hypothetical protein AB7O26_16210 [Planctomycetaceae bacterium]